VNSTMPDIILSNVLFKNNVKKSIIYRDVDTQNITWENIFTFMESNNSIPRQFLVAHRHDGKKLLGKSESYPLFDFSKYRLKNVNGGYLKTAVITISSCW